MLNIFKVEFTRAYKNKQLGIAILIGCVIGMVHIVLYVVPAPAITEKGLEYGQYPNSLFNTWIGSMLSTMPTALFYFILPILATLPYGDSLYIDRSSGFIKNICMRAKKRHYYISKYIVTFLAGGTAVVVPLLLNLWVTAMFVPAIIPDASTALFTILDKSMWCELFYSHPFVYTFLYLLIDFIYSGLICTISLVVSYFANNRFIVLLSPFIVYLLTFFIVDLNLNSKYNPFHFLKPSQPIFAEIIVIIASILILLLVTLVIYLYKGFRKDVL